MRIYKNLKTAEIIKKHGVFLIFQKIKIIYKLDQSGIGSTRIQWKLCENLGTYISLERK